MATVARLTLEDGGSVLVEAPPGAQGPVKAGRVADAIQDLPVTLQAALGPVTDTARAVLRQLRKAGPSEVEVEFGIDLAFQAGAVITRSEAGCHLKVKVTWSGERSGSPRPDTAEG